MLMKRPASSSLVVEEEGEDFDEEYEEEGLEIPDDPIGNQRYRLVTSIRVLACMSMSTSQNNNLKFEEGDKEKIEQAVGETLKWVDKALDNEAMRGKILNVGAFVSKKKDLENVVFPIVNAASLRVPVWSW